jgi:predicted alpha/beta hydrolase family esterase
MINPILIIPGIGNSGPEHWQTLWERHYPECRRVVQRDWDRPVRDEWAYVLDKAIGTCEAPPFLVAHSLGCLLVVHWASQIRKPIAGALLVAVPDPEGPRFPPEVHGFSPLPTNRLPFPSVVVASTDDIYGSLDHAQRSAAAWGSELIVIGAVGHINAESGLDQWKEGWVLVQRLLQGAKGVNESV